MNNNSTLKNILITLLALITLVFFIYSFIYGDRKNILIIMAIVGAVVAIYMGIKNFRTIKIPKNPESAYVAKIALIRVIIGSVILIIVIPVTFIFFT